MDELQRQLTENRPAHWGELPDIALYMDQLISYMPRQLMDLDGGEKLTSAMVNNYIKAGIVPRAEGKRYGQAHLAQLTEVCALKRVLTLSEMKKLFAQSGEGDAEQGYAAFCARLDGALSAAAQTIADHDDLPPQQLALTLALQSYASQLACRRVLEAMADEP